MKRKIVLVTRARLARATSCVVAELRNLGVWCDRLAQIEVALAPCGIAYGWKYVGKGRICIPFLSVSRCLDAIAGPYYVPLIDVLRHEYGHALLDLFPRHARAVGIARAFGRLRVYDSKKHVSPYAATNRAEDFCETFMWFLKCRRRLPDVFDHAILRRKWRAIARFCDRILKRSALPENSGAGPR